MRKASCNCILLILSSAPPSIHWRVRSLQVYSTIVHSLSPPTVNKLWGISLFSQQYQVGIATSLPLHTRKDAAARRLHAKIFSVVVC